jgi:hypothetical protein
MTYAELLDWLTTLSDRDLAKPVRALIADQVIPVFAIHNCGCEDSPLLDVGPMAGVPAGRA